MVQGGEDSVNNRCVRNNDMGIVTEDSLKMGFFHLKEDLNAFAKQF